MLLDKETKGMQLLFKELTEPLEKDYEKYATTL